MTQPDNLFDPPAKFSLPLSLGDDLNVDFIYKPQVLDGDGNPVLGEDNKPTYAEADWPEGATVTLVIDTSPPLKAEATVAGSHALVLVDYLVADQIKRGVLWRLVLTTSDGIDTVMVNGTVTRQDGK